MPLPDIVRDCSSATVNPSDPLCERMQGLLQSAQTFCSFRHWAFNAAGDDITEEFQDMIQPAGPAGGDLLGSTYPNPIIAPGVVTSAKMVATGVTPGPYTNPTLTVDIAGRITVIADGAAPVFGGNGQVTGSGSDHTVLGSYTNVVFGATDPVIAIPASGTYLLTAVIQGISDAASSRFIRARFYNVTAAAAISDSEREVYMIYEGAMAGVVRSAQVILSNIVTIGAASVTIQAMSNGGAFPPEIVPARTSISYIRLA